MSNCMIEGCGRKATSHVGSEDEYSFCEHHREAWGWYRKGYYEGQGFKVDGLIRKRVWDAAMKAFLEDCRTEIVACTQIVEALIREGKVG